jgi:hypothetical protein
MIEQNPSVLDLMASWDSHLPQDACCRSVVGLGLNRNELAANKALSTFIVQDINRVPLLPFDSESFDVVLNTVSVDYLVHPFEVFREIGRVLRPGGLLLVVFSNRMFPGKAVRVWREASDAERLMIVEDYFASAECFESPRRFIYQGRPRPSGDRYRRLAIPSDPVFAVFADKEGRPAGRASRPTPTVTWEARPDGRVVAARMKRTRHELCCPYCGDPLRKWQVPLTPFSEWDQEYLYACFRDDCPYLLGGWDAMARQGNIGSSYRLAYARERLRRDAYAIEAPSAADRRALLKTMKANLDLFSVGNGATLPQVAERLLDAVDKPNAPLSRRGDVPNADRRRAAVLRSRAVGLLNRLRSDLREGTERRHRCLATWSSDCSGVWTRCRRRRRIRGRASKGWPRPRPVRPTAGKLSAGR